MRETPRITDPTYVDPLVPRSLKALMDWDIFEPIPCDEFSEELEHPVTEDDALWVILLLSTRAIAAAGDIRD